MSDVTFSGNIPTRSEMAHRARTRGIWYLMEWNLRAMRAWFSSTIVYAVGQPLLYMIAMGVGLGAMVSSRGATVDGVSYLVFVAPAVLLSTVVMSASGEFTYPIMDGFKWHKLYYGPAATPVSPAQICLGHFLTVMLRFALQAAIFWVIMLIFGAGRTPSSILDIPIAVATAAAFGAPLMAFAASLDNEGNEFSLVQRFIVMPLFLFSGTFFPLAAMPIYLQWIGWVSPLWHGTQLARIATYHLHEPWWLIVIHLLVLLVPAALGLAVATRVYTRKLRS